MLLVVKWHRQLSDCGGESKRERQGARELYHDNPALREYSREVFWRVKTGKCRQFLVRVYNI